MASTPNLSSSAANAAASKNRIPGVCDCTDPEDKSALILYPSLGTPLLLAEGQRKASIFIVGESSLRPASGAGTAIPSPAPNLHVFLDRHLRVYDIGSKETVTDTTVGTLFSDGKTCATAQSHLTAWRVGTFTAGALIKDRHGRPFATVAPMAVQVYKDLQGGDIYEVELDLQAAPFQKINNSSFMSLAWMVKLNQAGQELMPGAMYAEPQDVMIARFLKEQAQTDPYHVREIQEFDLRTGAASTARNLPSQLRGAAGQLKSWHPVKYMPARALKLGHLTDVHVNVRHTALGKSPAKVLEGDTGGAVSWNSAVGEKVCNSFDALRALFGKMAAGPDKVDAVLLTGDLIDFNRNIDPRQIQGGPGSIGEQWKAHNLLAKVFDPSEGRRLYPRGLDDMLCYSLIRSMYRDHALPVFMTSGNHEAYQVPYGISARVEAGDFDNWAFELGVLETGASRSNVEDLLGKRTVDAAEGGMRGVMGPVFGLANWPVFKAWGHSKAQQAVDEHRKQLEAASKWTQGKANAGMSRDHNMTIYEACLAYGPTYGQALTGYNFHGNQFDWFYALFTPLADCVVAYGANDDDATGGGARQVIAALGWGDRENFKNLWEEVSPASGADRQGTGILPRAVESFSDAQMALLAQGQSYKQASQSTLTVASHFTIVSFNEPEPYSNVGSRDNNKRSRTEFMPCDSTVSLVRGASVAGAFNQVNVGTCERNLAQYLDHHVLAPGRKGRAAGVDWHLSGHSHRSGVYQIRWEDQKSPTSPKAAPLRKVRVVRAKDPGIHGPQTVAANTSTALVVSSCGGPIGYQNLDGELSAWTGRPPSGSVLDCATGRISQVDTQRSRIASPGNPYNEKPRLCVALDYLYLMGGAPGNGDIGTPLSFLCMKEGFPKVVNVFLSEQMLRLNCIEGISIWICEGGGTDEKDRPLPIKWSRLDPEFKLARKKTESTLEFKGEDLVKLNLAMQAGVVLQYGNRSQFEAGDKYRVVRKAFCEVRLRKPASTAAGEDWAKDMVWENDPWIYPLSIRISDAELTPKSYWSFARMAGEQGEVPDWEWMAKHFKNLGYIRPMQAIKQRS